METKKMTEMFDKAKVLFSHFNSPDFYKFLFSQMEAEMPAAKAMLIYAYDAEQQCLRIEHAYGFERNVKGSHQLLASEGLCGGVFSTGQSRLISNPYEIKGVAGDVELLVELMRLDKGNQSPFPSSIITVPILLEEHTYGVIMLLNFSPKDTFSQRNLDYVEGMAQIVALHCKFERLNNENVHMQEELSLIEGVLERDADMQLYSGVVSAAFSAVFFKGQEFSEMLKLASSYISLPMALYNMFLERLSCTDDAEDYFLPVNIMDAIRQGAPQKRRQCLVQGDKVVYFIKVQYGGMTRGILAIWAPNELISKKTWVIIETLVFYLSLVWLKKASVNEYNRNLKSELLTGILSGKRDSSLLTKVKMLGLEKSSSFFVLLVSVPDVVNHLDYCEKQDGISLVRSLEETIKGKTEGNIIVPEYNDICIIASCSTPECSTRRYNNIVNDLIKSITAQKPELTVSGSRIYETIYNVRKCYWEANQCLTIINKYFIHRKSANYLDMGVLRLLLTQKKEDIEAYLEDILGPVEEYDKSRDTDLLRTLFYYARFNKSIRYVSAKLNIHPNTLYQRIKKTEDLLGYDFENPMDWFDIQAASIMYGLVYTDLITKL
ncbi:MAG: helix-turn-helix domain-containing protein [Cloacibacillus sp.]